MENGDKKIKKGIKLLGYGMFGITEVISVSKKDMLYNLKILGDFDETFWVWIVIIVFISATMTVLICYIKEKCIFRKNRALAPHERSAVPLGTDHCPVG